MATVSEEYEEALDDEFVEVQGKDFAPTHDWDASNEIVGVYQGKQSVRIKDDDRTKHTFIGRSSATEDEEFDVWGAAILDSRLAGLEGKRVKAIKTGKKVTTKTGRKALEFKVFVAKSALRRAS